MSVNVLDRLLIHKSIKIFITIKFKPLLNKGLYNTYRYIFLQMKIGKYLFINKWCTIQILQYLQCFEQLQLYSSKLICSGTRKNILKTSTNSFN